MRVRLEVPMYAIDPSTALTTRSTSAGSVRSALSGVVILICVRTVELCIGTCHGSGGFSRGLQIPQHRPLA